MQYKVHTAIGATFKLEVFKADGTKARESGKFKNLVLDAGLIHMGKGDAIGMCMVGTGNSEPNVGQTKLDSLLASTTRMSGSTAADNTTTKPYYMGIIGTFRFNTGEAIGNLTEVGIGWTKDNCWNRALIKDALGNPTTLTILADEYLDITVEIRMYPVAKSEGAFNFRNKLGDIISSHTFVGYPTIDASVWTLSPPRINNMFLYTGSITDNPTARPSGSTVGSWSGGDALLMTGDTKGTIRVKYGLNDHLGAVKSMNMGLSGFLMDGSASHGFKFELDKPISTTNSQEIQYTFEFSWGRHVGD